jgi:hypothetical protein
MASSSKRKTSGSSKENANQTLVKKGKQGGGNKGAGNTTGNKNSRDQASANQGQITDASAGVEKATVDSTTNMLLDIRNMSEREIGTTFRCLRVEEQVKRYCKSKLFHWLKFIVDKFELGRLKNPHDIGNVVMMGLNVADEIKPRWWLLYQDVVKKSLDTQRSNCNMAIKSVMLSK